MKAVLKQKQEDSVTRRKQASKSIRKDEMVQERLDYIERLGGRSS